MNTNIKAPVSAAIAIAIGLIVLLGYFVDLPLLIGLRAVLLRWAVILTAVALLVGLANLASVHWRRVITQEKGSAYSTIVIITLLLTLIVAGLSGPTSPWSLWIFSYIQVPAERSLMALLAVVLVYTGARLLSRRINLFSLIFVATVVIVLIGTASLPGLDLPIFSNVRSWITQVPAVAGARGILLGVALGTIATGLRVMIGADRPFGG